MANTFASDLGYSAKIKKQIRQKTIGLLRKTMMQGQRQSELVLGEFVGKLRAGAKKYGEAKIDLVINRAERIVRERIEKNPDAVAAMVQKLFRNIAEHTDAEITANPSDAKIIKATLGDGAFVYQSARKVTIKEDDGFDRGSLIIKANKSIIDAHVKTQLERARMILLSRVEKHYG